METLAKNNKNLKEMSKKISTVNNKENLSKQSEGVRSSKIKIVRQVSDEEFEKFLEECKS